MNKTVATVKNVGKAYGSHWALKDICFGPNRTILSSVLQSEKHLM